MDRRTVITGLTAVGAMTAAPQAAAQQQSLDALFAELEADPSLVENAWSDSIRQNNVDRGVGSGERSLRVISQRAIDMIVRLEVSSRARYESRYTRPIWPRGRSGVTIGIGYDLQFASEEYLRRDWDGLLPADMIATLVPVLQLGGAAAQQALPSVQSVVVPWEAAQRQFQAFLPYPTADAERVFPNTGSLSNDSFGALVSLVYNRGTAMPVGSVRRREMLEIRDLMAAGQFASIPQKIRDMKQHWPNPDQRGLVLRREIEARLFELGLA